MFVVLDGHGRFFNSLIYFENETTKGPRHTFLIKPRFKMATLVSTVPKVGRDNHLFSLLLLQLNDDTMKCKAWNLTKLIFSESILNWKKLIFRDSIVLFRITGRFYPFEGTSNLFNFLFHDYLYFFLSNFIKSYVLLSNESNLCKYYDFEVIVNYILLKAKIVLEFGNIF